MKNRKVRWQLVIYDIMILFAVELFLLLASGKSLSPLYMTIHIGISMVCVFFVRFAGNIYGQIWRYGGIQCYMLLICVDTVGFVFNLMVLRLCPIPQVTFVKLLAIACMNLLGSLVIRMLYRYAFKYAEERTIPGKSLLFLLRIFAGSGIVGERKNNVSRIKIAIIGAGRVGVTLAEELLNNCSSSYTPCCFVDINKEKAGRMVHGIPVLLEEEASLSRMEEMGIQEVVFAITNMSEEKKKELYDSYRNIGYRVKVYDFPLMNTSASRRTMREFDVEELLFRKPILVTNENTQKYYKDKVILITGGGGSIGSELCRQVAKMQPKQLIILDICENGAYDVQQELRIAYQNHLDVKIEILSITHKKALEKVFEHYRPQVVIHAAAHKHVPLMEHNCVEAVQNNIFGTKNVIELCEEYETARFMMVSTDKAVNPTNVMGATKRMCEMMVQSASAYGKVTYSCTRFGNVLGSAGSVIPLFKKQIAAGGPITLTDKRIIRYFMTIPEASSLVLESGAIAKNGELFVLDMGEPVKILDLAENMIHLSGASGIKIEEIGLRPGEKLYEELLVRTEELDQTENHLIYIERDHALSREEINSKLHALQMACEAEDNTLVRLTLQEAVPTFVRPEEKNSMVS